MDAAFKTAPYPAYSSAQLQVWVDAGHERADVMRAEIARRAKVAAGYWSVMTAGERLRRVREQG